MTNTITDFLRAEKPRTHRLAGSDLFSPKVLRCSLLMLYLGFQPFKECYPASVYNVFILLHVHTLLFNATQSFQGCLECK